MGILTQHFQTNIYQWINLGNLGIIGQDGLHENDQNISWCLCETITIYNLHSMMAWVFRHQLEHTDSGEPWATSSKKPREFWKLRSWHILGGTAEKEETERKKERQKGGARPVGIFFSFLQRWELTHWAANIAFQIPRPLATDQSSEPPSIDASLCADRWKSKATPGSGRNRRRRRLKNGWNFWISPQDYQFPIWGFIEWDAQIIRFGLWSGNKWWFKQGPPVCGIQ